MSPGGYTVEVTGLSPKAEEKDVLDFFAFCGPIELVEIIRSGEDACTAYVTFKDAYSQETACLLSGATIVDQRVCITRWGHFDDEFGFWSRPSGYHEEDSTASAQRSQFISSAGNAVTMAQEVVKTMLSMGYVLGKDALTKAKTFDESHQVSATAAAKVADLSHRIGLTDMIGAGFEAVKTMDEKYHVLQTTKSAISATGRTAAAAADTVVQSGYFSRGALFVSDALNRAAKVAADLGSRGVEH
ncbi:binding partner of ACD11 1-like [Cucurbita pepo subsp. pepo]|uniref:Binding partner of ACD11 1-like n=1 Tax=Cucurbita maxima TaxID=3661 RepID=A0A6J1JE77_CUCMA|nr:binding partner of ACD11 1-like [Cucurbita maxima]XP_022988857.1 binding partner of ACD11 1-like [Cucurbita maxima]XP_023534995.1 binding partner of ACD11 1-like [Cucurbita pepo subsp. pepo]XP_023535002.1 binding partner of ACD11 1-like [Cucurbita pepo subsp. pepo]